MGWSSKIFYIFFDLDLFLYTRNLLKPVLSTKSPFEFVFSRCEFPKVILYYKSFCEMKSFWYAKNIYGVF